MNDLVENNQFNILYKFISASIVKSSKKQIKIKDTVDFETHQVITYNGYVDFATFLRELKSAYYGISSELEKNSVCFSTKSEYIFYLKGKHRSLADAVEDNFYVSEDGTITLLNFDMNLESDMGSIPENRKEENYYKPFFEAQYKYAKRAALVVNDFIQTIIILSCEDISFKTPEQIKSDMATSERPLAFFQNFFLRSGLWRFRKSFEPTDEDYLYTNVTYNTEAESKTIHEQDPETGEYETYTENFTKVLSTKLGNEFWKFIDAIDAKIDSNTKSKDEISNYLIIQIAKIKELKDGIEKSKFAQNYGISNRVPVKLMKHIVDKYKHYIPAEILRDVSDIYKSEFAIPFQKLTLKISSKEFVQLFGNFIRDRKMQLNGISDVQPIAEILATFFNIPKTKGEGMVLASFLQTEFKKFMAPPTTARSRK